MAITIVVLHSVMLCCFCSVSTVLQSGHSCFVPCYKLFGQSPLGPDEEHFIQMLVPIPLNMWDQFSKKQHLQGPSQPQMAYRCAEAQHSHTGEIFFQRAVVDFLFFFGWFTFRMIICFLKSSENSFFLFEGSSSL